MSDSAFKSAPFAGYTTDELRAFLAGNPLPSAIENMRREIARREAVANGDYSQATDGERLRAVRAGKL